MASLLDIFYDNEKEEQRRRSLERAIGRQAARTPIDTEFGLLSSAARSRTPARRGDYPEIEETLGRLRPREVEAAYEMGREQGLKAAALGQDIPSVMQLTPEEIERAGVEGAMSAMVDPDAYGRAFVSPVQERAAEIAQSMGPVMSRMGAAGQAMVDPDAYERMYGSTAEAVGDAIKTAAGSVYTGLTDPSVVQPSADDNVLQRAMKSGVGRVQQGVGALTDLATSPLVAARDIGRYLGSPVDDPYIPDYMEAIGTRIDAAKQRKAVEDAQEPLLKEARRILSEREQAVTAPQTEDMDSPPESVTKQQAEETAAKAVTAAATRSPSSLLGDVTIDEGLLASPRMSSPRRQQEALLGSLPSQLQDLMIAYGRQQAAQPQLVTAADLDKLRPITPATLFAGAEELRKARQAAADKLSLSQRQLDVRENVAKLRRSGTLSDLEYTVMMKANRVGYKNLNQVEKDIYNKATDKPEIQRLMERGDEMPSDGVTIGGYTVKTVS